MTAVMNTLSKSEPQFVLSDPEDRHLDEKQAGFEPERPIVAYTPEEEKKVLRKIDWRLLPIMAITYGIAFYDKVIIGQAVLFGLRKDLDLVTPGTRYSLTNSVFYIGYIFGLPIIGLVTQRFPLGKSCAVLVLIWGFVVIMTVLCTGFAGIIVQRFFLGFIEAGIAPSFVATTALYYTKREQAFRATCWVAAAPATNMFSPMINYGLGTIGGKLKGWQNMYLFAGCLTMAWSIVVWFMLPDDIPRAKFLTPRDREIAQERIRLTNGGSRSHKIEWDQVREAVMDINVYGLFILAFGAYFASGVLQSFSSLIIATLGYSTIENLAVQIPKGAVGVLANVIPGYFAMKYSGLRFHIYTAAVGLAFVGSIALLFAPRVPGLLGALYGLHCFGAAAGQTHGLNASNVGGYTKRTVATVFTFMGYATSQIIAPLLFNTDEGPRYTKGFIATLVVSGVGLVWSQIHRFILRRRNQARDRAGAVGTEHGLEDISDFQNKDFRYAL